MKCKKQNGKCWCDQCRREYDRKRHAANAEKRQRQSREHRANLMAAVREFKGANPCTDCGQKFHPAAMQFDHCRGEKIGDVATLAGTGQTKKMWAEIEKCDLVCANCHAVRTYTRRGVAQR